VEKIFTNPSKGPEVKIRQESLGQGSPTRCPRAPGRPRACF